MLFRSRFLAFNKARRNLAVPAGFLLGFMRKWRKLPSASVRQTVETEPQRMLDPTDNKLQRLIKAAPITNRLFHASDLCRLIGPAAYDSRVLDVIKQFGCQRFSATLAVHGGAALAGEILR